MVQSVELITYQGGRIQTTSPEVTVTVRRQ